MAMKRKTKHDRQLGECAKQANKLLCKELERATGLLPVAVNHIDYQHDLCRFSVIFLRSGEDITFHYLGFTDIYITLNESPDVMPVVSYIATRFTRWLYEYVDRTPFCDEDKLMKQFYIKKDNPTFRNLIRGVMNNAGD